MRKAGMVGKDMNKPHKPKIAEMGGIGVVIGVFAGIFTTMGIMKFITHDTMMESRLFLTSLFAILGAALVGSLDDLFNLRQRVKAVLPAFFAIPMAYYMVEEPINFPIVGTVFFGYFMLILVPFMMSSAANSANMLEGFNGLGTGLGIIMSIFMVFLCLIVGNPQGLLLLLPLMGALVAFLYYNKYPAKVFPGDIMMLFVGSTLAAAAINGLVKEVAILLFIPMIAEFFVKLRGNFHARNHGKPDKDGYLVYKKRVESLTHLVMKNLKVTEPQFVLIFWVFEAVIGFIVISTVILS